MELDDPLEQAIALKAALAAKYGYDVRKIAEGVNSTPLDPSWKVVPPPERKPLAEPGYTLLTVPNDLLPEIRKLIAERKSA